MTLINSYVTAYTQDIQVTTMPTANVDNLGRVVQFVGTTTSTYTNGYFYECVSDGELTPTYSWVQTDVQPSPVIPDPLPSQTGQSGKFLTTDGTDTSWGTINALQNTATHETSLVVNAYSNPTTTADNTVCIKGSVNNGVRGAVAVGTSAEVRSNYGVSIGHSAINYANVSGGIAIGFSTENYKSQGISIGYQARTNALYSIQIGSLSNNNVAYNPDDYTFKVANGNGNYEMLSADGTIPEARLADTTSATQGQVLTLDANLNATWATPSGGGGGIPTLTWYTVDTAGNTLTIADTSSAQLVKIYKNGLLLQPTEDYSISGTTLTTTTALIVGDKITTEVF